MRATIVAMALALAAPLTAATLQEQYTAAQAAFDAGRMPEARTGFAAVLPRLDANPKMKTQAAIVRARMGAAAKAMSEPEAAIALIGAALPALEPKSLEWVSATLELGLAQELAIEFEAAARSYRTVIAASTTGDGPWVYATLGATRVLTFSDPAAARGYADALLQISDKLFTDPKKRGGMAELLALRGRIDLAAGRPAEARVWFDKALAEGRSLTDNKVSIADVRVRGDAGIAAFFSGDFDATRKYLAYTGAGRLPDQGFDLGADIPLPPCTPVGNVSRSDMAVVEFQIGDDGRVTGAAPVYATNAVAAVEFARAVRGWSWKPEAAVKLDSFWRQAVRLELRCANRGPTASDTIGYGSMSAAWLATQEALPALLPTAAAALPVLERELARRIAVHGPASPQLLPVLLAVSASEVRSAEAASRALASAKTIATASNAPPDLLSFIRLRETEATVEQLNSKRRDGDRWRDTATQLEKLLADFDREGLGPTRGAAVVAMRLATWAAGNRNVPQQTKAFRRIIAIPLTELPDGDMLRQSARLGLASIEAAGQRLDVARALLAETGLTAEQCSTMPVAPQLIRASFGESDFPRDAMRWGFEGITRMAFDIGSDGKPMGVRTVIASPPLIFNAAAEKVAGNLRYRPAFRDGAGVACADQQRGLRFSIR